MQQQLQKCVEGDVQQRPMGSKRKGKRAILRDRMHLNCTILRPRVATRLQFTTAEDSSHN